MCEDQRGNDTQSFDPDEGRGMDGRVERREKRRFLRHTCDQENLSVAAKRLCVTAGFKRLHADDHGQI